ncbi:hypothetical protein Xen7305DRAFT_00030190 [Xenococcus sp. PCC 7305]|uniref:hypothetical protein n=1 Tax=Xenococcus sp. PCC 7305 TaxID=102125 RepID=UPI0002AC5361|nr:hypothetical protein [Xenococcus sp. PCC 7305]ELS03298.1 hypothetical protein Xen7305DRAFT_00030190 [Xenococcus sp. PCC 7305]
MSLNAKFRKVISSSFCHLSVEDLKPIVLALWHEGYIPELSLSELNAEELRKAGYLIDRFRGYNCVPRSQKRELEGLARKVEQSLSDMSQDLNNSSVENLEPLAEKWNLSEDISHVMSSLLQYQTRHYLHTSA